MANGLATITFVQGVLDTLMRSESEPPQIPLEDRLAMMVMSMDYEPQHLHLFSWAIQWWWRVVGMVIFKLRMGKIICKSLMPYAVLCSAVQPYSHTGRSPPV